MKILKDKFIINIKNQKRKFTNLGTCVIILIQTSVLIRSITYPLLK